MGAVFAGYSPGTATAVLGTTMWLLLDAPADVALARELDEAIRAERGPGPVLDVLSSAGITQLPSLAMACTAAGELWALTRGEGRIRIERGDQRQTLDSPGLATWGEHRVRRDGLTAAWLLLGDPEQAMPANPPTVAKGRFQSSGIQLSWTAEAAEPTPAGPELTAEWRSTTRGQIGLTPSAPPSTPSAPAASAADPDESNYDYLFGATSSRSVEGAAVRARNDDPDDLSMEATPPRSAPSVPARPKPVSAPMAAAPAVVEDEHAHTVRRPDPVAAATPKRAAPGVLALSTGARILLDRNVVLGRRPTRTNESEQPHLVKLTNSAGDVSRNHVAVEIQDGRVRIRDLGSTNGTYVSLPGDQPKQLLPDQLLEISPGTRVLLADGVFFDLETE